MAKLTFPREIQQLKGADKKNPQRYRNAVPRHKLPCGEPPSQFSRQLRDTWHEISDSALPGVMTHADTLMLEMLCYLLVEFRADPPAMTAAKLTQIISILARFGMSPSDRTKFNVDEDKVDDCGMALK